MTRKEGHPSHQEPAPALWGRIQIFADDTVAHVIDRLAKRAEVFHLEGTSYRETHRRPVSRVAPA